jgi:hypothetical protein
MTPMAPCLLIQLTVGSGWGAYGVTHKGCDTMKGIFKFIGKNAGKVVGQVTGLPILGALGGAGAAEVTEGAPPVDTMEGAIIGLVIAILAVIKQFKAAQKAGDA